MERAIPLGRIAGIRIGMSWTVPLIAFLYTLSLSGGSLPLRYPNEPSSSYWLAGLVGSGLFFLSLLAHEMGHALVGRREGLGVRGVTLNLLGGVTEFEGEARTPGAELRVSGIGPLTNLVLAVGFFGLTQIVLAEAGLLALLGEMLAWLAFVNLLLALVNMLPGAPLDGGAVLGAIIWSATGDRTRAQRTTSTIGLVLGGAIAALGLWLMVGAGGGAGIWLMILGAFIFSSARHQRRIAPALGALRATTVGAVMAPDPPIVPEQAALSDVVARAHAWAPHTAFPVQAVDGRITGLLTAEIVMAVPPASWPHVRAIDAAWPIERVPMVPVDEPVLHALHLARAADVDRVLVLWPDGRVAGVADRTAEGRALHPLTPSPA